jgi:hypothetical protein
LHLHLIISYTTIITVAEDVLTADNADTATETFVDVLDDIFTNDSYATTVLEGGTSQTYLDNLVTVTDTVGKIESAVAVVADEAQRQKAQDCLTRVNYFLALLAGVVEGPKEV